VKALLDEYDERQSAHARLLDSMVKSDIPAASIASGGKRRLELKHTHTEQVSLISDDDEEVVEVPGVSPTIWTQVVLAASSRRLRFKSQSPLLCVLAHAAVKDIIAEAEEQMRALSPLMLAGSYHLSVGSASVDIDKVAMQSVTFEQVAATSRARKDAAPLLIRLLRVSSPQRAVSSRGLQLGDCESVQLLRLDYRPPSRHQLGAHVAHHLVHGRMHGQVGGHYGKSPIVLIKNFTTTAASTSLRRSGASMLTATTCMVIYARTLEWEPSTPRFSPFIALLTACSTCASTCSNEATVEPTPPCGTARPTR